MKHVVYKGASHCSYCGRAIKTIHQIDGKPYGSECASTLLGKGISAPAWLYERANAYANACREHGENLSLVDFEINFWSWQNDLTWTGDQGEHALYNRTVSLGGNRVSVQWQSEVVEYLRNIYI